VTAKTELIIFITPTIIQPEIAETWSETTGQHSISDTDQTDEAPPADSIGLNFFVETGLTDANIVSRVFYVKPGISYEFFKSGFSVGSFWEIPLIPMQGESSATVFESFVYDFKGVPITIYGGNENSFSVGSRSILGSAYLRSVFLDVLSLECVFAYLPERSLRAGMGVGYTFDIARGFSLGISEETYIELIDNPGLREVVFSNSYSYAFGRLSLTAGAEAKIDFSGENGPAFRIAPDALISISL
jgi:hypothetical protein